MAVAIRSFPGDSPTGRIYVDSLIWGTSWDVDTSRGGPEGTITYSFDNGTLGDRKFSGSMKEAVRKAFDVIDNFIPVKFQEIGFLRGNGQPRQANLTYVLEKQDVLGGLGYHQVPGDEPFFEDSFGSGALIGAFAGDSKFFSDAGLQKGGLGFEIIMHEILHGLGLAHPHDNGGSSSTFPGVTSSTGDYGRDGQNQGVFTIMSYNSGYPTEIEPKYYDIGNSATPMALDIAALQAIYGTKRLNIADSVYKISGENKKGVAWKSIWDTNGEDTISAEGVSRNVVINLKAADLGGSDAGGSPSYAKGIHGGFTIANGVVIENAIGGSGNDRIKGNSADNELSGKNGEDKIYGRDGNDLIKGHDKDDTLSGDDGSDRIYGGNGRDTILISEGDGNDHINGGDHADWLIFSGNSSITVDLERTDRQDTGAAGNDRILNIENVEGGDRSDQLSGTSGTNILRGALGGDTLNGKGGRDNLYGGNGDDLLLGGSGADRLYGGKDDDTLIGSYGKDYLRGGSGADHFVFKSTKDTGLLKTDNVDVIRDFEIGVDKIDLNRIDANSTTQDDDAFIFKGQTRAGTSEDGEVYYEKVNNPGRDNDYTLIIIDTDSDKSAEMMIQLTGLHDLTADDFIL